MGLLAIIIPLQNLGIITPEAAKSFTYKSLLQHALGVDDYQLKSCILCQSAGLLISGRSQQNTDFTGCVLLKDFKGAWACHSCMRFNLPFLCGYHLLVNGLDGL